MNLDEARALLNRRHKNPGQVMLDIIKRDGYIVAPGCHDGMTAAITRMTHDAVIKAGMKPVCEAVYGSGWSASAMRRYLPDMGFHDRTEMTQLARFLVEGAYPLPVILDGETGFGPRVAIPELVRLYSDAGVAVIHLEDQPQDRRCGHMGGKEVDDLNSMLTKLSLIMLTLDAIGSDMLLMARTDAYDAANGGPQEAIRRAKAFADLRVDGCKRRVDFIWCELPDADPEKARAFAKEMREYAPDTMLALNYSPNMDQAAWYHKHGVTPATYTDYAAMGYSLMFHTVWSAKVMMEPFYDRTLDMMQRGAQALYDFQDDLRGHPTASGQSMSRAKEYQDLEKFIGGEEAAKRFANSRGFGSTGAGAIHDVGSEPDGS